ncbi:hypothetical protein EJ110_NYTH09427 [Nymphaea thermarum]|nr:hypothetical protein EJ110_NYTH09427 [Nymphaea thermarum]
MLLQDCMPSVRLTLKLWKHPKQVLTGDVLMILYGYVGKEKEIERTWKIIESHQHVRTKSFILAIEAFGRIGHINRAEELWLEMKTKKDLKFTEQFNAIISVYTRYGLVDKASELFKEMLSSNCKPNAITYHHLALGCLRSGLVEEALKTLVMACDHNSTKEVSRSTPWLETTLSIIEVLAATGDVGNTMKLFMELKEARYSRYTFVHNTLLRSYVKAKTYAPDFLRKMILGGSESRLLLLSASSPPERRQLLPPNRRRPYHPPFDHPPIVALLLPSPPPSAARCHLSSPVAYRPSPVARRLPPSAACALCCFCLPLLAIVCYRPSSPPAASPTSQRCLPPAASPTAQRRLPPATSARLCLMRLFYTLIFFSASSAVTFGNIHCR